MERQKFEGKSEEEAIQAAAEHFQRSVEEIDYHLVGEVSRGPFGILGKRIVIEAWMKQAKQQVEPASQQASGETEMEQAGEAEQAAAEMDEAEEQTAEPVQRAGAEKAAGKVSDLAEAARKKLDDILRLMGVEEQVRVEENEREIRLDIQGEAGGIVIGSKGQTLDALQFIMERIVSHIAGSRRRILLDANGYRSRRVRQLQNLAERLSERAIETRKPVEVEQMSARDRRIIHLALENVAGVTTRSEGEGEYRKLLIVPTQAKKQGA